MHQIQENPFHHANANLTELDFRKKLASKRETSPQKRKPEKNQDDKAKKMEENRIALEIDNITTLLNPREKGNDEYDESPNETPELIMKKQPNKTSRIKICLTACRYESIRRVANVFGMREVGEEEPWNFCWTDMYITLERAKEMNRFQRVNHFPGMLEICRKDLLARNLNRMQKIYPKEYNFFPKTWCLPANYNEAITYSRTRKNKTFIIKPECGSQGRGIYLTKSLKEIRPSDKLICQVYVAKPYLVDGLKFDIRVYALITSCDPLRIFVYNEGLVRFATSHYADPNVINSTNMANVYMHLTNYAINKHSRTYVNNGPAGSKRKISTLNKILKSQGVDMEKLWHSIDQVIVKTVISAWPVLKHSYHACFPTHDLVPACFEILGFDILLDHRLHPYLLEVNHSPSFHTDTQLDREVKEALLIDTFSILNIWQCDKRRLLEEHRREAREQCCKYVPIFDFRMQHEQTLKCLTQYDYEHMETEKRQSLSQMQWEESHLGNFRRVYPVSDKYARLIRQTPDEKKALELAASPVSKAKGDYAKQKQQEKEEPSLSDFESPKKQELQVTKPVKQLAIPATASPGDTVDTNKAKEKEKEPKRKDKDKMKAAEPSPVTSPKPPSSPPPPPQLKLDVEKEKPVYLSRSYEPDRIVATEERARLNLMAQRDFLIRSYGLLETIYLIMKKVGTLKPCDERKYSCYGMLQDSSLFTKMSETKVLHPYHHYELELQDTFLSDEDFTPTSINKKTTQRKTDKVQDEKVKATWKQKKEDIHRADSMMALLMRCEEGKMMGEDVTSQPTSRTAPIAPAPVDITKKKKKRKRSQISICLTACRYESIRKVANAFGMREVSDEEAWNFYWTDMSVSVERAKEMKRFQRINHFPGMLEICRKDLLARNLNRMQKIYPKEYNFFPKTWCFPADFGDALSYSKSRKNKTFIIKPECGSQGRGIFLTRSIKEIKPTDKLICQVYLSKPYLVDGYKFDIRVYTLITSCDPLRIFVYNEGLVRFATSRYADPNTTNTTNVFMHLTNYSLNKHSRTYVYDSEAGSKRKISTLNKILLSQGVDLDRLWHTIDQVIVKTVISAWPILKHSYHACFPSHDMVHACFEILGFDILLDHKLHPFILEVNHSPSFHTDTQLDREVKEALLTDTFTMLNIWQCDKRRVLEEDRRRIRDRLLQTSKNCDVDDRDPEKSPWQTQVQWEETHLGNFRRVYPVGDQYASLFQQPSGSLYTATAASRARGDCTRQQQQEFQQTKAKAEALKKVPNKDKQEKKAGEEATPVVSNTATTDKDKIKHKAKEKEKEKEQKRKEQKEKEDKEKKLSAKPSQSLPPVRHEKPPEPKPVYVASSFEPDPIVEKEERERINQLAQRDFLIRSYGLLEQIYLVMKKMGTLRPEDERKYGVYGRLAVMSNSPKTAPKKSNTATHKPKHYGNCWDDGLRVECRDAVLCARPLPPPPPLAPRIAAAVLTQYRPDRGQLSTPPE